MYHFREQRTEAIPQRFELQIALGKLEEICFMHITQQQEQFSNAYLLAVATVAGLTLAKPEVDDDSIDFTISGKGFSGQYSRPRLEVQLKCQMLDKCIGQDGFRYSLKIKNYNDLRATNILVPRLLIVVIVPTQVQDWLTQSDHEAQMKYCGYWQSIRGRPETLNTTTISISIPQANRLDAQGLTNLMQRIALGETP
jgi:hypothetical protein